jgi:hypothetical protein
MIGSAVGAAAGRQGGLMSAMQWVKRAAVSSSLLLLSACTITTRVEPVPPDTVRDVCIKENTATWSKEFLPELRAAFERRGITSSVYAAAVPPDCVHRVEYDANWSWDLAVYPVYLDIRVYDHQALIGQATYDARDGSGRLDKFGRTSKRLDELMTQLLGRASAGMT